MKICLLVFKIRGFEGGIRVPKHGGPLNSTKAGLLNQQTSKISINSFWIKNYMWVFEIRGFEGGIRVPKHGGPLNSTKAGLLNHQTSKISINSFWIKIYMWVF
jgi:ribosomal protein S30